MRVTSGKDRRSGRRAALLLYPLFLVLTVAAGVEVGARLWLDVPEDTEEQRRQTFAHLLNSAVTGGEAGPLGVRLTPNQERTIHWTHLSYRVRSNSLGFRGREPEPRRPGEQRLLFLGDSMVFGHGLEEDETIPARIESLSADLGLSTVTCYNGAMNGFNTVQALLTARRLVPQLQPDRVLLGYFVGNDPLPNTFAGVGADDSYEVDSASVAQLRRDLDDHLVLWRASTALRAALPLYVPHVRYRWSRRREVVDRSMALVDSVQALSHRHDADFALILIYPRDGVEGGPASWWSGSRRTGRRLRERLEARGVEVLDTIELMDGRADRDRYYFPLDGHLNPAGADRIGDAVVERWVSAPGI